MIKAMPYRYFSIRGHVRTIIDNSPKRLIPFFTLCIGLLVFGCGAAGRNRFSGEDVVPVSHSRALEMAVARAFETMKLPRGGNSAICVQTALNPAAPEGLVETIATEMLLTYGYKPVTDTEGASVFKITADSLSVALTSVGRFHEEAVDRTAEAVLMAEIIGSDGSRTVYRGTGSYEDRYKSQLLPKTGTGDPFLRDERTGGRFMTYFKPLVIGVTMTIFTWALYSYRG